MNTAQCNLSTDAVNKQESSHIDTKLTVEQYNQLISMLSKQGNKGVESKEAICSNAMQVAGNSCFNHANNDTWIIDRGASEHMFYNLSLFDNYKSLTNKNHYIVILNANKVIVNLMGDIRIRKGYSIERCLVYHALSIL